MSQSKKSSERSHARRRALERYGIDMGPHTRKRIISAIQNGTSRLVEKQSLRVTVHDVDLDDEGTTVRVCYDRSRKEIITFLPAHTMEDA